MIVCSGGSAWKASASHGGLVAGAQTATLARDEVERLVLGDHIATIFTRPPPKSDRLTANAILKTLERIIGLPRQRSGTRRSCATFGRP
jgi:hypothetical protein